MSKNNKPTETVSYTKDMGGLSFILEYYEPSIEDKNKLNRQVAKSAFIKIHKKVMADIPSLLTYANFLGEAETYMVSNGIPYSPKIRDEYAKAIRSDFMKLLEVSVIYNEDTGTIEMSPYIYALEFGDYYRPAMGFISNCIKEWLTDMN